MVHPGALRRGCVADGDISLGGGREMIKRSPLQIAIAEAHRFLSVAVEAQAIKDGKPIGTYYNYAEKKEIAITWKGDGHGPANAAAKRASMDLTRALAKMRKY